MSPETVVLEVFFVRFPLADPEANGSMWDDVDEQGLAPELRGRLARNGIRAGVLSGQLPRKLSDLLEIADKPAPVQDEIKPGAAIDLQQETRVVRRQMPVLSGGEGRVIASDVYDAMPVLVYEEGQVGGQPYRQAQALFSVRTRLQPDGRARLELTPEIHHDQPEQRWVGSQGVLRPEVAKPKRVFKELAIPVTLAPGEVLLMTNLPHLTGSLGHYFFTQGAPESTEQKLLAVRLFRTQHNDFVAPNEALPLTE